MKRIFLGLFIIGFFSINASAISIDENSAKAHFIGFKLANKIGVPGEIRGAVFSFKKTEGSIKEILDGANASMDFINEFTNDNVREENIYNTYTANLENSSIEAYLKDVKGNEEKGEATAVITFNNVTKEVPMSYEIQKGKLTVKGSINMKSDFATQKAYEALSTDKQISKLHGNKTHEDVEIYFDVDVK